MQLLCVIPARLGSTRLLEKPLRLLSGEPLVRWVAQRALELDLAHRVVVAADHPKVVDALAGIPVDTVLTDPQLGSGTERVAAVAGLQEYEGFPVVINIQGDEPFVPTEAVRGALERVEQGDPIGTAASPLSDGDLSDTDRVKVVVNHHGHALRFSRTLPASHAWQCDTIALHHIGIYAYRRSVLKQWIKWVPAPNECADGLEQLRPLHNGVTIGVAKVDRPVLSAIDTERDLAAAEEFVNTMSQRVGQ